MPSTRKEAISQFIKEKKASKESQESKFEIWEYVRELQALLQMPTITEHSKAFLSNAIDELNDLVKPDLSASTMATVIKAKKNPKKASAILSEKQKAKQQTLAALKQEQTENTEAIAQRSRDENERAAKIAALKLQKESADAAAKKAAEEMEALEAQSSAPAVDLTYRQAELGQEIAKEEKNVQGLKKASGANDSESNCTIL